MNITVKQLLWVVLTVVILINAWAILQVNSLPAEKLIGLVFIIGSAFVAGHMFAEKDEVL